MVQATYLTELMLPMHLKCINFLFLFIFLIILLHFFFLLLLLVRLFSTVFALLSISNYVFFLPHYSSIIYCYYTHLLIFSLSPTLFSNRIILQFQKIIFNFYAAYKISIVCNLHARS